MSSSMPSSQPFDPSRSYNPAGAFGSGPIPGQSTPPAKKSGSALLPQRIKPALITVGALAALMIIVQTVNWATGYRLDSFGVEPRSLSDLWNVLTAPLVHASWGHLFSNLVPLIIFGVLIMLGGVRQFIAVTAVVWLVSGLGVVLLALYGGLFWTGIVRVAAADITGVVTVSWQAHLFGALGGLLAAFMVSRADGGRRPAGVKGPAISS